jgi:phosphatidylglycerol:prolipoprotein diacylglycerol transferase
MYPTLPFGPLSLPTGPFFALIALWLGLEIAARFGKRMGQNGDDIWNTGLLALAAGLIVARLWNVIQFWDIYASEPLLIFSLRPSGYALLPGAVAALIVGYLFLMRKAMDPVPTAAAFSVGAMAAASVLSAGAYLSGAVVGIPSDLPWALPHYGQALHPVGLYRALGFALLTVLLWKTRQFDRPLRTLWLAGFGYSLIRLFTDGFVADAEMLGPFRASQVFAFVAALIFSLLLVREEKKANKERTGQETVDTTAKPVGAPGSESLNHQ